MDELVCNNCGGSGLKSCPYCTGIGSASCPGCFGSSIATCDDCSGSGSVESWRRWEGLATHVIQYHRNFRGHPWTCTKNDIYAVALLLETGDGSHLKNWSFASDTLQYDALRFSDEYEEFVRERFEKNKKWLDNKVKNNRRVQNG